MKSIFWLAVIVAVGVAGWLLFGQGEPERQPTSNNNQNQTTNNPPPSSFPDDDADDELSDEEEELPEGNVWYGMLRQSNDPKRGNLMLELNDSDRTIYINSARDWSSLIDKEVAVHFEGDENGFSLIDIKPHIRLN